MGKQTLVWSCLGGLLSLMIGFAVWAAQQHAEAELKISKLEVRVTEVSLVTDKKIADLRLEIHDEVSIIDKKQEVEFAKINASLRGIDAKLAEISAELRTGKVMYGEKREGQ